MVFQHRTGSTRGFMLVELLMLLVIIALIVAFAGLIIPDMRRRAMLAGSTVNLQQIGKAATGFAADNENRACSFTWAPGNHRCGEYVFPPAIDYLSAASAQAVCILRESTGRTDITSVTSWIPHALYNYLPLIDYLGDSLPSPVVVSPGDAPKLAWARAVRDNPQNPLQAFLQLECRPAGGGAMMARWAYASSYETQFSFVSPDGMADGVQTFAQANNHRMFTTGNSQTVLGNRRMDEVCFPSHKAFVYETAQRFFGNRELYFMDPEARVPVLFADGSLSVRSMGTSNRGFNPNNPFSTSYTPVLYAPELTWEPPISNGTAQQEYPGRIRWTRSGLRGRDFQALEVPWGQ